MSSKLRILVVEDSETDALLMLRELRKGDYEPDYERVDAEAAMMNALRSREWDVIICDYNMPAFRGDHALSLLKESGLDVPFILLSGTIGEETAVDMMKAGAHDYIMKDNLARLVPAIRRELQDAKNRQEKREAQAALQQSEEKYRTILENIEDGYYEVDLSGNLTFFNKSLCRILGYSKDELMGMNYRQYMDSEDAEGVFQTFNAVHRTGNPVRAIDWTIVKADGERRSIEASASLVVNYAGEPVGFRGIARGVTERMESRKALKDSEERYRTLLQSMHDLVFVIDKHDCYSQYYTSSEELLFISPKEFMGRHMSEVLPPSVAEQIVELSRGVRATGESKAFDYPLEIGGQKHWFSAVFSLHEDSESIVQVVRDITKRKQAEEALRESEEWFRTIYEESLIAINVFDPDGNLIHANPACINFAGVSSVEDLKGFNVFEDPNLPNEIRQRIRKGERVLYHSVIDFSKVRKAGLYDTPRLGVRHVEAGASPLRYGEDEALHGYMVQMVDVTGLVLAEANTKAAAETAMLYLDLMGHDIRNQLQAIIMGTEIVEQLDIRPEVREMVDIVSDSVEKSQNLIRKVQATRELLSVPLSNTSLRTSLEDCLQVLNETYDDVQIEMNLAAEQPTVFADKYLGNLLMNILENAILHNDKKSRRVWLDLREAKGGYEVVIADNGPGIANDKKENLFDQSRRFGGVGVHQAFKIIQKYGGHITVQDRVPRDSSKGAEFHIWFPKSTS